MKAISLQRTRSFSQGLWLQIRVTSLHSLQQTHAPWGSQEEFIDLGNSGCQRLWKGETKAACSKNWSVFRDEPSNHFYFILSNHSAKSSNPWIREHSCPSLGWVINCQIIFNEGQKCLPSMNSSVWLTDELTRSEKFHSIRFNLSHNVAEPWGNHMFVHPLNLPVVKVWACVFLFSYKMASGLQTLLLTRWHELTSSGFELHLNFIYLLYYL